jgi:hypothetical protein
VSALGWLRKLRRPAPMSSSERERAARLGVYFVEAAGFDRSERSMFTKVVAVCLNAEEAADRMSDPGQSEGWEDVEYKRWGPRPLSALVEAHVLGVAEARALLARAAKGEAHEILPAPLTPAELSQVAGFEVFLIWYEDKFHYGSERDSFAISVCFSREEAEADCKSKGRRPAESGGDGYEVLGPTPLQGQVPEVVREVLRRRQAGEPGPVPIPSRYW